MLTNIFSVSTWLTKFDYQGPIGHIPHMRNNSWQSIQSYDYTITLIKPWSPFWSYFFLFLYSDLSLKNKSSYWDSLLSILIWKNLNASQDTLVSGIIQAYHVASNLNLLRRVVVRYPHHTCMVKVTKDNSA